MTASSTFTATDGDAYERQMGRWSQRLAPPFLDFVGPIGQERILDVGSGTGKLTRERHAAHRSAGSEGSTFPPAYVAHARGQAAGPRIEFEVGDACAMPFPDASSTACSRS